jgi:hypothetical protein
VALAPQVVERERVQRGERGLLGGAGVGLVQVDGAVLERGAGLALDVFLEAAHVEVPHVGLDEPPIVGDGGRVEHAHEVGEALGLAVVGCRAGEHQGVAPGGEQARELLALAAAVRDVVALHVVRGDEVPRCPHHQRSRFGGEGPELLQQVVEAEGQLFREVDGQELVPARRLVDLAEVSPHRVPQRRELLGVDGAAEPLEDLMFVGRKRSHRGASPHSAAASPAALGDEVTQATAGARAEGRPSLSGRRTELLGAPYQRIGGGHQQVGASYQRLRASYQQVGASYQQVGASYQQVGGPVPALRGAAPAARATWTSVRWVASPELLVWSPELLVWSPELLVRVPRAAGTGPPSRWCGPPSRWCGPPSRWCGPPSRWCAFPHRGVLP